jgi:hypothetical protein
MFTQDGNQMEGIHHQKGSSWHNSYVTQQLQQLRYERDRGLTGTEGLIEDLREGSLRSACFCHRCSPYTCKHGIRGISDTSRMNSQIDGSQVPILKSALVDVKH